MAAPGPSAPPLLLLRKKIRGKTPEIQTRVLAREQENSSLSKAKCFNITTLIPKSCSRSSLPSSDREQRSPWCHNPPSPKVLWGAGPLAPSCIYMPSTTKLRRARRRRPVVGHTSVGLATAGGLAEISAGVLGTAATWVASTGSRATGREAQTPRLVGAWERQARGFGGGALRCLA
jgi:hypothetical protein